MAKICDATTYLHKANGGETHPALAVVESGFISANKCVRIHDQPLQDVEVGVQCATSATRMIGPIFSNAILSHRFCKTHTYIPTPSLLTFLELQENLRTFFRQDSATAHAEKNFIRHLQSVLVTQQYTSNCDLVLQNCTCTFFAYGKR
jgi:hypothetical protein